MSSEAETSQTIPAQKARDSSTPLGMTDGRLCRRRRRQLQQQFTSLHLLSRAARQMVGRRPPLPSSGFPVRSSRKLTFGRQSHMISEEPRIIFFHYWGRGSAQNLAQSIQKALPATVGTPAKPRASVR